RALASSVSPSSITSGTSGGRGTRRTCSPRTAAISATLSGLALAMTSSIGSLTSCPPAAAPRAGRPAARSRARGRRLGEQLALAGHDLGDPLVRQRQHLV